MVQVMPSWHGFRRRHDCQRHHCSGYPALSLCPDANEGWGRLRDGFIAARKEPEESGAERILIYSTMWPSVIGHQIQADPEPEWVHVDELFHDGGSNSVQVSDGHRIWRSVPKSRVKPWLTRSNRVISRVSRSIRVALQRRSCLNPDNRIPARSYRVMCTQTVLKPSFWEKPPNKPSSGMERKLHWLWS